MMYSVADVKCDKCGSKVVVNLSRKEVNREERAMGDEVQFDSAGVATCACSNKITFSESLWEYPEGVLNYQGDSEVSGGTLL
jgi:hypothetical protein